MRPEKFTDAIIQAYRAGQDSVMPVLRQEQELRQAAEGIAKSYEELAANLRREVDRGNANRLQAEVRVNELRREVTQLTTRWSDMATEREKEQTPFNIGVAGGLERAIEDLQRALGTADDEE